MDWAKFITRKFMAATLTVGLMVCAWVASNWLNAARENLPALFTGMVAVCSAYIAGNVIDSRTAVPGASEESTPTHPQPSKPD